MDEAITFERNAKGVREMLSMKYDVLPFDGEWYDAFGTPERTGTWIVWGNSGTGKTTFAMKLAKYLCRFGRVAYDSLEEGACLNIQKIMRQEDMMDVNGKFLLLNKEPMDQLSIRLKRRKAPDFVIVDSFQYAQLNYKQYIALKEKHENKLLIFISHAEGISPEGRAAKRVMYDVALKVYCEGYRAISKGRFAGPVGHFEIWPEKSKMYHGEE